MSGKDKETIKFGWIRIDRKTDIIALTAFLLALFGALFQVKEWLRGPEIEFYAPDRVVVYKYEQPNGIPIVRIAAPMSYTNTASSEYSAAIRTENVTMKIGSLVSEQVWISFARLARNDKGFNPQITADASPTAITGNSAVSHSTLFGPFEVDCSKPRLEHCRANENYLSIAAMSHAIGAARQISFEFSVQIYNSKTQVRSCTVNVTQPVLEQWAADHWLIAPCNESAPPSLWSQMLTNLRWPSPSGPNHDSTAQISSPAAAH
jgi:hypothetical protein